MTRSARKHFCLSLADKYPPSPACACDICRAYCVRPGWWTVEEAGLVITAGYARRMMLEVSPEQTFGVLAPAFKGCEGFFGLNTYSKNPCTFLVRERCELFGSGLQPLECRYCHHSRVGLGRKCHADLERDWDSPAGQDLVVRWLKLTGLWSMRALCRFENWRRFNPA